MGLERPLRKHAGGMFLGRGRVHQVQDASIRMWIELDLKDTNGTILFWCNDETVPIKFW
jgi:hypothetical protein